MFLLDCVEKTSVFSDQLKHDYSAMLVRVRNTPYQVFVEMNFSSLSINLNFKLLSTVFSFIARHRTA